jgi:hypothetical protein
MRSDAWATSTTVSLVLDGRTRWADRRHRERIPVRRRAMRAHLPHQSTVVLRACGARERRDEMTDDRATAGMSEAELEAEGAIALPDKEVVSILDLNADLNLAIDAAAPIDLAVAANANVAAPIDAAVSANILSSGSASEALSDQGVLLDQNVAADATATAAQDSTLDQSNDVVDAGADADPAATAADPAPSDPATIADPGTTAGSSTTADTVAGALDGNLLNVDVKLDADADIAAPIGGAVAANANVAAPIDAAVSANIGSVDSTSIAVSQQDAIINQNIEGSATATTDQQSDIQQ